LQEEEEERKGREERRGWCISTLVNQTGYMVANASVPTGSMPWHGIRNEMK